MSDSSLEVLLAKQSIAEMLHRYCRGVDRGDLALLLSVWHQDGTADYGEIFNGSGHEFARWVVSAFTSTPASSHQISSVLIDVNIEEGTAVSEAYVIAAVRGAPQDGQVTDSVNHARYLDRWSSRSGVWAVDHRRYVDDLVMTHRFAVADVERPSAHGATRDLTDPSYALFGS